MVIIESWVLWLLAIFVATVMMLFCYFVSELEYKKKLKVKNEEISVLKAEIVLLKMDLEQLQL